MAPRLELTEISAAMVRLLRGNLSHVIGVQRL
jgi:hypothetical protein